MKQRGLLRVRAVEDFQHGAVTARAGEMLLLPPREASRLLLEGLVIQAAATDEVALLAKWPTLRQRGGEK